MLPFLRKYQKVLFGLVAFVVILSFSVFGVSSAFFDRSFEKEKFITGKNGVSIKESDIKILSYLFATHPFSNPPNFVEDNFVEETFLQTGILSFLLKKSASFSEAFWQEKKERVQNFSLYKHPKFPFLDVEAIWKEKAPGLWEAFSKLTKEFSQENYIRLFWEEIKYPGVKTKQAIWAKMQKNPSLYQDPAFFEKEFALFGFSGIREWFSPSFVEEMAQFVLEGACLAQKEGAALSRQEQKQEIIRSLQKKFPSEKGEAIFQKQLQLLGIPEALFLSVWEKALIFQKWLNKAALLSEKSYIPKEKTKPIKAVKVRLVSIKPEIQGKSPLDTLASEKYFETVLQEFSKEKEPLFSSAEEVKKKAPELVYETYSIKWAETTPKLASLQIPTKKMMQWLLVEENKRSIAKKFPEVSIQEKAPLLDKVPVEKRKEIEEYVREQMVLQKKDWAQTFLEKQKKQSQQLFVNGKGELIFSEVQDPSSFLSFLQKLSQGKEELYQEGNRVFSVELIEKRKGASLFSLEEVLKKGILEKKIEDSLLGYYKELEKTNPSLFKDKGVKKSFSEAKEDLANLFLTKGGSFYSMTKEFYESKLQKEEAKKPFFLEEKETWIEEGSPFFKEALSKKEGEFSNLSTVEGISFFTVIEKKEDDSKEKKERALLRNQGKLELIKRVFGG